MIHRIFYGIAAVAFGALIIQSAQSVELPVQMGTKLVEPINSRRETLAKYKVVISNYEYVLDEEGNDTWDLYDGTKTFKGDCEDFAFTLQAVVGAGSVHWVMTHADVNSNYVPNHVVFIYAGRVWELNGEVYDIANYQAKVGQILWDLGDISPEWK